MKLYSKEEVEVKRARLQGIADAELVRTKEEWVKILREYPPTIEPILKVDYILSIEISA